MASGCGSAPEGYEPDLRYDVRRDPLVLASPASIPTRDDLPKLGKLDEYLHSLPSRGGRILDPAKLPDDQRNRLRDALDRRFGTPAAPRTPTDEPELELTATALAAGSAGYRQRCSQCHGYTGDARGPTGPWITPMPRDFRTGQFKCAPGKPRVEELARLLRTGVPGTSMPLFDLVSPEELRAMAGYVIHLSVRGEVELEVLKLLLGDEGDPNADIGAACDAAYRRIVQQWKACQAVPVAPPVEVRTDPDAIRRGQALFTKAGCIACHAGYGNTDTFRYDAWGFPNQVADLRDAKRKWGGEPNQLDSTIRRGIPPAMMPAADFPSNDMADLVAFLRALPFSATLPPDVRATVEAAK